MGAAVLRWGERLLSQHQPEQAEPDPEFEGPTGARSHPPAASRGGHPGRELSARHDGPARARLCRPPRDVAAPRILLDLSQNFSVDSPPFAFYEGPTIKWVKKMAFEGVNAQWISSTNHIATHLDSPLHFNDPGPDVAGIPLEELLGPACIVDLAQFGVGDYLNLVPYQPFRTRDGFVNVAVGSEALWQKFCDALGIPLANDPRFARNADRVRNRSALLDVLRPAFARRTTAEWVDRLLGAGVPAGPIYRMREVMEDPQVRHREMVVDVDHPRAGRVRVNGVPVKLSDTPGAVTAPPPVLGEHSEAILGEFGVAPGEIASLRRDGVI
ncbi:MAG: hypothetical protein E6H04_14865 [Bacillati bacterium ANGP1]|uniref:Cyclase family protein n=1 Tax=Candidatus Segetimicrobium genomatis TaxID=2569760 RepID=A0A537IZC7_9BACT|nr:MAG: hypothetical protein E6H04_14865 [Terrabacteria group bacterium ANGP1]